MSTCSHAAAIGGLPCKTRREAHGRRRRKEATWRGRVLIAGGQLRGDACSKKQLTSRARTARQVCASARDGLETHTHRSWQPARSTHSDSIRAAVQRQAVVKEPPEPGTAAWPPPGLPSPFIESWSELEPPDVPDRVRVTNKPKRKMSEEQKEKIRASLKGGGHWKGKKKSSEHREKIRQSMLRKMNVDSTLRLRISASAKGKPKVCKLCGTPGHNSRTCSLNPANATAGRHMKRTGKPKRKAPAVLKAKVKPKAKVAKGKGKGKGKGRRRPRCSVCGKEGHNRRTCPEMSVKAAATPSPTSSSAATLQVDGAVSSTPAVTTELARNVITSPLPLPLVKSEMCDGAVAAVLAAHRDGILSQKIELNLQRTSEGLDMESWAGGIREQFTVALPIVERFLSGVKQEGGFTGRMSAKVLDVADAVGCWKNNNLAAVLFPTADTLESIRYLCNPRQSGSRLVMVINPEWQDEGNVISAFGFGMDRQNAMEFIESFQPVFCLRAMRVLRQNVSVYRQYPGMWQLHIITPSGLTECLGTSPVEPSYRRITELVRRYMDKQRSASWLDRVRSGNLWNR